MPVDSTRAAQCLHRERLPDCQHTEYKTIQNVEMLALATWCNGFKTSDLLQSVHTLHIENISIEHKLLQKCITKNSVRLQFFS